MENIKTEIHSHRGQINLINKYSNLLNIKKIWIHYVSKILVETSKRSHASWTVDESETIMWGYKKSEYEEKLKLQAINLKFSRSDLDFSTGIYLCDCFLLASSQ